MAKGRNLSKAWSPRQQGGWRKSELAGLQMRVGILLAGKEAFCSFSRREEKEGKVTPFV